MVIGILALVAGLVLVVWGAERFTDGAIRLAARLALSTFFVGAVVSAWSPRTLPAGLQPPSAAFPRLPSGR